MNQNGDHIVFVNEQQFFCLFLNSSHVLFFMYAFGSLTAAWW